MYINKIMENLKKIIFGIITLFTSSATLICCALPALLISLGMGAVMAGLVSNIPQLVILSKYKIYLFIIAGIMLLISYFIHIKNNSCPIDKEKAKYCAKLKKFNKVILFLSISLYITGVLFAYIIPFFI